jgi:Rha family phage regulatory protein
MATQTLENPVIQVSGTATVEPSVEVANLCEIKDGQVVTTSLRVAEIFSKQHNHVLRAIRELDCSDDFRASNFGQSFRIRQLPNGMGERQDPYYLITRDGFVFLVMGFTGKTAAKFKEAYIRAFNEMEAKLRRQQEEARLRAHYTFADAPRVVHDLLQQPDPNAVVESYGQQRVVSTVTLARLTGRKHENVCTSVRRMFKYTLRPQRLFIRQTRTVRKGFGRGYDSPTGVMYLITIEGFRVMCTHAEGLGEDVAKLVMTEFYKAKGKNRPGQPNGSTPKPTPPEEPTATAAGQQGPTMPKDAADMMRRMVQAMAVMMGVDVNEVSNLISGGCR